MKEYIWILGGLGPEASQYLYKNILHYCQKKYWAIQDTDYPHMLINNIWLEGFDETWIVKPDLVKEWLLDGIKQLENAGVHKIYIACNTVHTYYQYLQEKSQWKIINLIQATCDKIKKQWHKKVLILSSKTTNDIWLYDAYLQKLWISFCKVNTIEQDTLDQIIESVMGWMVREKDFWYIEDISKKYKKQWATGVIIGCTELPLATRAERNSLEVFDTIEILTEMISASTQTKSPII